MKIREILVSDDVDKEKHHFYSNLMALINKERLKLGPPSLVERGEVT